jgi:hypothetical protein
MTETNRHDMRAWEAARGAAPASIDWPHINALRDTGARLAEELGFRVHDIATLDATWTVLNLADASGRRSRLFAANLLGQELLFYPDEAEGKLKAALYKLRDEPGLAECIEGLP